ncbi:hypothetical protein A2U01_0099856, partial [Trifolium medium]|nr:hypothetical protein [Trifolium medium]
MLAVAESGYDERMANVAVWPSDHAFNTARNHLTYLYRLPSNDRINGMAT